MLKNKQIIGEVGVQWTATPMPKLTQVGVSSSILLESPTNMWKAEGRGK